jgi:hypothetical protein
VGRPLKRLALAWLISGLFVAGARAQISPGDLSRAHATLEGSNQCLQCHSSGRGVDRARCLTCHQTVSARIAAGKGLHARPEYAACERCHIEHHGRDFELVYWGKEGQQSLDHRQTGFTLEGVHARTDCRKCHAPERVARGSAAATLAAEKARLDRTFLGLGTACSSCHEDPHRGQFRDRLCSGCHDQERWKPASRFDHAQSRFPLTGKHRQTECARCHRGTAPNLAYQGASLTCVGCHTDQHQGKFGKSCESCHGTEDWKSIDRSRFDHDRTRYPLRGKHAPLRCESCHRAGQSMQLQGFERCSSCHADAHAGQFANRTGGIECASCHDVRGFRPATFDLAAHDRTSYPLAGAHRRVGCEKCHGAVAVRELPEGAAMPGTFASLDTKTPRFRFRDTRCESCHRDPHAGDAAKYTGPEGCGSCHTLASWREVRFDHARTGFLLEGGHSKPTCSKCHAKAPAKDGGPLLQRLVGAPKTCAGCHADPHRGQFGRPETACTSCHQVVDWKPTLFDHARAAFRLDGAHRAVACIGCHPSELVDGKKVVRYRPVASQCADCHSGDVAPESIRGSGR